MKKTMTMVALVAAVFTAVAEMARSEWLGKVGACAQNPALLQQTIGQLSASDQLAFLGQVNQAISAMPGSKDQKAAAFYAANKAAVVGATPANRTAVLAEVYATVPVEVLTVVNERFADELLSRKSSPNVTDAAFVGISTNVMAAVNKRTSSSADGGARAAFAAMMLVRASGGTVSGLADTLADMISDPAASKEAKSTWLPAATSGDSPSYDQILGSTQAGDEPNKNNVNNIAPASASSGTVLSDLSNGGKDAGTTGGDAAGTTAGTTGGDAAGTTGGDAAGTTAGTTGDDAAGSSGDAAGNDNFQGGIFISGGAVVPGAVNPAASADAVQTVSDTGVTGAGADGAVPVTIPRDAILNPTMVDPTTGEIVPNPYYNKKRGETSIYEGQ